MGWLARGELVYVKHTPADDWILARVESPAGDSNGSRHWFCEALVRHVVTGVPQWISERSVDVRRLSITERLAEKLNPTKPSALTYPKVVARLSKVFDLVAPSTWHETKLPASGPYLIYERGCEWPIARLEPSADRVYGLTIRSSQVNKKKIADLVTTASGATTELCTHESALKVKRRVHPLVQLAAQAEAPDNEDPGNKEA